MPSLSRSLEQALHHAIKLASERHHEYATLEHLLLALMDDNDASQVMKACNVDMDALRKSVQKYVDDDLSTLVLDDATAISETVAICRYFEETNPEPPLFGTTPAEKALVDMWVRRVEFVLMMPVGNYWRHAHPRTAALLTQYKDFGESNQETYRNALKWLDRELAGREFIAGDAYTVADICAAGCRAVVVPLSDGIETEQIRRAEILAEKGLAMTVSHDRETPEHIAAAIGRAMDAPPPDRSRIDLDGAPNTARILADLAAGRSVDRYR